MTPPKAVRVLGKRYAVELVQDPNDSVYRGMDYSCLGATDYHRGVIRVRGLGSEISADEEADTILHEFLHVVWLAAGLGELSHRGESLVETSIKRMTPVLLDALRRNPELVAYLVQEDPDGQEETQAQA